MRVLVTGADGFIGKNLLQHLHERKDIEVVTFTKNDAASNLAMLLRGVDCVCHLAGVNRPLDPQDFVFGNTDLTEAVINSLGNRGQPVKFILTSSTQAERSNPYGDSKRGAESLVQNAAKNHLIDAYIYRLPNVFGKWCKPNYNSAVATFCHNIANGIPIVINDRNAPLELVYVDDVISSFLRVIDGAMVEKRSGDFVDLSQVYKTTVGEVAQIIESCHNDRKTLKVSQVGLGLQRALYATYVSYLPPEDFAYSIVRHADDRGVFVEMLKTETSGQFSYFTARPGITRGGHYHHTKTEKFLVIKGRARFCFRNVQTNETKQIFTDGENALIVDTAPGWAHDITNVGDEDLIVMLWANEIFDREKPDTFMSACGVL
jgi:UDP-2-acetamido-2,6-beta-L-arabino-hexul-4-ose reductase